MVHSAIPGQVAEPAFNLEQSEIGRARELARRVMDHHFGQDLTVGLIQLMIAEGYLQGMRDAVRLAEARE